jgi:hypothetical protein
MLDHLSGRRLEMGFGLGWLSDELSYFDIDVKSARERDIAWSARRRPYEEAGVCQLAFGNLTIETSLYAANAVRSLTMVDDPNLVAEHS